MNPESAQGVLLGYVSVLVVIALGYAARRSGAAPDGTESALNRIAFSVATPSLYFVLLATSDIGIVLSSFTIASAVPMVLCVLVTAVVLLFLPGRRRVSEAALLAVGTVFTNTGNIGIPIALYAFGTMDYVAPIILLQVLVMSPVLLVILDLSRGRRGRMLRTLGRPFQNPIIVAAIGGLLVALFRLRVPDPLMVPLEMLGSSSIPILLLAFGMSMRGARLLRLPRRQLAGVWTAVAVKTLLLPASTFLVGFALFQMSGLELLALVVISSLPTAQSIYNYATQYGVAVVETRSVVLISTALSIPLTVVFAALAG